MNPRVTGQNLLDQRRPGTRHAEDKHRLSRIVAGAGEAVEQLRREALNQPIDEPAVFDGVVEPILLDPLFQNQRISLFQAARGRGVVAASVTDVGQAKKQVGGAVRRRAWDRPGEGEGHSDQPPAKFCAARSPDRPMVPAR